MAVSLPLRQPFRVGNRTQEEFESVFLAIASDTQPEIVGLGEVALSPLLARDDIDAVCRAAVTCDPTGPVAGSLSDIQGRAALDMALLDLTCKEREISVATLWDVPLAPIRLMETIGIATPAEIRCRVETLLAVDHGVVTVKLKARGGDAGDVRRYLEQALGAVRSLTSTATIIVDANCTWTPSVLRASLSVLHEHGVAILEEPLVPDAPLDAYTSAKRVSDSTMVFMADERCVSHGLDELAEVFGGVNVKLGHVGGPRPGRELIHTARRRGLVTMVGCNGESALGLAGALAVASDADYADLDSSRMIDVDPASGVTRIGPWLYPTAGAIGHGGRVDVGALLARSRTTSRFGAADLWDVAAEASVVLERNSSGRNSRSRPGPRLDEDSGGRIGR